MKKYVQIRAARSLADGEEAGALIESLKVQGWEIDQQALYDVRVRPLPVGLTERVIISTGLVDDQDYALVESEKEYRGIELSKELLDRVRNEGVCVRFLGYHPNSSVYGLPAFAYQQLAALDLVNMAGFKALSNSLEVEARDTGDDSGETYFLTIAVTPELAKELREKLE